MSTPQERRRLLQERRQAKMANGKATDRLNAILNQGSSVKASSVTSVLETPKSHDDDPDTSDIDQLLSNRASPSPSAPPQDVDQMLNQMFGAGGGDGTDPISNLMMNMMKQQQSESGEPPQNLEDMEYESKLLAYHTYKQKQLKVYFLFARYFAVLFNFWYHFTSDANFRSSSYSYVRAAGTGSSSFLAVFVAFEAVALSAFYLVSSRRKVTQNVSSDSLIMKGISMAAMVVPQVAAYQPLLIQVLGYWEVVSMLVGDLSLVVVLFGLTSYLR